MASLDEKRDDLLDRLAAAGRVVVAFSGGVDSAVVARAAQQACGIRAFAVTAVSSSLAEGELADAERTAEQIGIRHQILRTTEFSDPNYLRNAPDRCYFCKTELYTRIVQSLRGEFDTIVNGANCDDLGDYRPGLKAADEHHVRSPLIEAGFSKLDVRALAREWNLNVADKPATPCLSSRIAYGIAVTPELVQRIDRAERFLRDQFPFRELRVRCTANDTARIEVPRDKLALLTTADAAERIVSHLKSLGFRYVTLDLEGFRSGSLNAVLPLERFDARVTRPS